MGGLEPQLCHGKVIAVRRLATKWDCSEWCMQPRLSLLAERTVIRLRDAETLSDHLGIVIVSLMTLYAYTLLTSINSWKEGTQRFFKQFGFELHVEFARHWANDWDDLVETLSSLYLPNYSQISVDPTNGWTDEIHPHSSVNNMNNWIYLMFSSFLIGAGSTNRSLTVIWPSFNVGFTQVRARLWICERR